MSGTSGNPGCRGRVTPAGLLAALLAVALGMALWLLLRETSRADNGLPADVAVLQPTSAADGPRNLAPGLTPALPTPADATVEPLPPTSPEDPEHDARHTARVIETWGRPRASDDDRAACTLVAVDSSDSPVPGATVELWGAARDGPGLQLAASQLTDGEGRATVSLPDKRPSVRIHRPGTGCSGMVSLEYLVLDTDELRLVVVPLQPGSA